MRGAVGLGGEDDVTVPAWEGRRRADALRWVKAQGRANKSVCVICKLVIDYDLAYPDPKSCSVQHLKSRKHFPMLTWVRSNWAPAHLDCNQVAGAGDPLPDLGLMTEWL